MKLDNLKQIIKEELEEHFKTNSYSLEDEMIITNEVIMGELLNPDYSYPYEGKKGYYEYKDMNKETCSGGDAYTHNDDGGGDEDMSNNINEANKLCMKQTDKKILTLDNYVIKTIAPKKEMILPKTKNVNLKDPKFKKKDIKVSMSISTTIPTTN